MPRVTVSFEGLAQSMEMPLLLLLHEVPVAFESSPPGFWIFPDLYFSFCGTPGHLKSLLQGIPFSVGQVTNKQPSREG